MYVIVYLDNMVKTYFYLCVIVIYSNCTPYLCPLWSPVTAGLWVFLEKRMEEAREGKSVSFPRLELWAEGLRSDPV